MVKSSGTKSATVFAGTSLERRRAGGAQLRETRQCITLCITQQGLTPKWLPSQYDWTRNLKKH